jgi:proteasome maturation protein
VSTKDTAGTFGLHDTLLHGPRSLATEISNENPLKKRLESWEETQDNLKLTLHRNTYGLHAPMRLLMERKIVTSTPHMPGVPQSDIHLDILMGRDETIDPVDIFGGMETGPPVNPRQEIEKSFRM